MVISKRGPNLEDLYHWLLTTYELPCPLYTAWCGPSSSTCIPRQPPRFFWDHVFLKDQMNRQVGSHSRSYSDPKVVYGP